MPTHEDDTHEDFKPKFKPDAEPRSASSVTEQIEQDVKQNPVFLYMKVCLQAKTCTGAPHVCQVCSCSCSIEVDAKNLPLFSQPFLSVGHP